MKSTFVLLAICFLFYSVYSNLVLYKLEDGMYSFADVTNDYASLFVVTGEGVLVIEPVNMNHATKLLEAIRSVTNETIKYIFTSHNHWDHAIGAKVFQAVGVESIAHAEAYEWMVAHPHRDLSLPDKTWDGNFTKYTLGNTTLELHFVGMSHGMGMTVFYIPQRKFAYMADIVVPKRVMFTIVPDFNTVQWVKVLDYALTLDFDRALFTHNTGGNISIGGNKTDVENQRNYIVTLRDFVRKSLGNTSINPFKIPELAINESTMQNFKGWVGFDNWIAMNTWRLMMDELLGPYGWRPARVPMCEVDIAGKVCKVETGAVPTCKESSSVVFNFSWKVSLLGFISYFIFS